MNRLQGLKTFIAVAERQSFAAAARSLRVSATAVSRAITDLEHDLGATLLRRTTRSVALTPEGARYLARCRMALADLDEAERELRGVQAEPRGLLSITAPVVFGRLHVRPLVSGLLATHRHLEVSLNLTDQIVPIAEDRIDVAFRIADLADSALLAARIAQTRRVLVASPAYLDRCTAPQEATDLDRHDLIASDGIEPRGEWRFTTTGRPSVRVTPRFLTNSVEAAIDAALDGGGIARALSYQVDAHVTAGHLVYLLPELDPPPIPIHLVFQASRRSSAGVVALIEAARQRFQRALPKGCGQAPVRDD